jgi:hypothetical protein
MKKKEIGRLRRMGQSVDFHDLKRHGMVGMERGRIEEQSTFQAQASYLNPSYIVHLRSFILTWQISQ